MATRLEGTDVSHTDFSASNVASGSQTSASFLSPFLPTNLEGGGGQGKSSGRNANGEGFDSTSNAREVDDSTSLSQRKELLKLMQPSFRGRNGKLLPRAPN
ncbi:hypothetical protein Fot_04106 [Forsythia ovata]|uniref:Uncharacterized protein n=1 Tax=Forsythia ovata TaxID=205694 RepID=A0ABD1XBF1_9LAMI